MDLFDIFAGRSDQCVDEWLREEQWQRGMGQQATSALLLSMERRIAELERQLSALSKASGRAPTNKEE